MLIWLLRVLCLFVFAVATVPAASAQSSYRVIKASKDLIAPGKVAFVDTAGRRIVELDRAGKVVWNWPIPASVIGDGDIRSGADLEWIAQDDSFLLTIPFRGIFRVSRSGKVMWQYRTSKVSHDADLLPTGNVLYVWGWDASNVPQVYEVDPQGKLVWSWEAKGKVDESWRDVRAREARPSYTHANAAVRLPDGDTLVSLRNFHRVLRVSPAGEIKRVWGPIRMVHEPTLLPDGTLIASPHGPRPGSVIALGGGERRIIFPNTIAIDPIRTVEVLKNGNYLLTGGEEIVEIDAGGTVVWQVAIYQKGRPAGQEHAGRGGRGEGRGRGERGAGPGPGYGGGRSGGERGVYKAVWVGNPG